MSSSVSLALLLLLGVAGGAYAQSTHVVRPGETLWGISGQHFNEPRRWPELQRDNAVPIPERLQPGQVLTLGGGAVAAVADLSGNAWLKRGNDAPRALVLGAQVQANDVLVTDYGAFLSLGLPDGSRVVMPSSSAVQVLVVDGRLTQLELLNGRVEAHVQKQRGREFEIRNRIASLGVRGTNFRARNEEGITSAEVIEGTVAVSSEGQQRLTLTAARGALLEGANAMQVQTLLPPPQRVRDAGARVIAVPVPEARGYRMQLAHDERFLQVVYEARSEPGEFAMPADLPSGFYHLRLTAFDAQQLEGMPGDGIVYVSASETQTSVRRLDDGRYEIRWPTRLGQRYEFDLARTPTFVPLLASEASLFGAGALVETLSAPGRYYWRARETPAPGIEPQVFEGSFDVPAPAAKSP